MKLTGIAEKADTARIYVEQEGALISIAVGNFDYTSTARVLLTPTQAVRVRDEIGKIIENCNAYED